MNGREHLMEVALRMLVDRGYDGVGVREIAEEAGVTTGSIYHYFDGKDGLFRAAAEHFAALAAAETIAMSQSDAGSPGERLERVVAFLEDAASGGWRDAFGRAIVSEFPKVEGLGPAIPEQLAGSLITLLRQPIIDAVTSGDQSVPDGCSPEQFADVVTAGFTGVVQAISAQQIGLAPSKAFHTYFDLVLRRRTPNVVGTPPPTRA